MPDKIFEYIEKYFFTIYGLFWGYLFLILLFAITQPFFGGLFGAYIYWFDLTCTIIYTVFWVFLNYFYVPKFKSKGQIGVLISFAAENDQLKTRIEHDVVNKVRDLICSNNLVDIIDITIPTNFQIKIVNKILNNKNRDLLKNTKQFEKLAKNNKFAIFIWGEIFERCDTESKYFIESKMIAKHALLDKNISDGLSSDMGILLPRINFPKQEEYSGFVFTKELLYLGIRYLTGTVLFHSLEEDNIEIAHTIHCGLLEDLDKAKFPIDNKIRERLKIVYGIEKYMLSFKHYREDLLEDAFNLVEESLILLPNSPEVLCRSGFMYFHVKRNTGKALARFEQVDKLQHNDNIHLFNIAFIKMYLRNFTEALNIYDHLSLSSNEQDSIADECIAYNLDIYQKEGKIQCLFVAGYLQYRIKDNLPMALEYLEEYSIAAKNQKGHSCLTKRAYKYLSQIRKSLEQIS